MNDEANATVAMGDASGHRSDSEGDIYSTDNSYRHDSLVKFTRADSVLSSRSALCPEKLRACWIIFWQASQYLKRSMYTASSRGSLLFRTGMFQCLFSYFTSFLKKRRYWKEITKVQQI